jgi:AmmeMemoRadiSam system protein B
MRKAIVAGSFYSSGKKELEKEIEDCFLSKFGFGSIPKAKRGNNETKGIIAPHAGYAYSGPCASYAYAKLAESSIDTFIILGTNHTGYAESHFALSLEDFETPLGIAKTDKEFYNLLAKESKNLAGDTSRDKIAHQKEHSIEVQIPFLQFLFNNPKILPIICRTEDAEECSKFAKIIVKTSKKLKRKICVIASSDFTHYGFSYGFVPFASNVEEKMYSLDNNSIEFINQSKTKEFLESAGKTTICGAGAIALCMEICKEMKIKKSELLKYYTSGDITKNYNSAVGYASIAFG